MALMCSEKESLECHRSILVSRCLAALGISVEHILSDGRLESHTHALARLTRSLGLRAERQQLFRTHNDLVSDAYRKQEQRIACVAAAEANAP